MEIKYNIEEEGDETCPMHLWTYYSENGEDRYRECRKCWLKQKKNKVWRKMQMWTDWRH